LTHPPTKDFRVSAETSIVLIPRPPIELQELLADRFELFHFQENPTVTGFFDFELRSGMSTERNAIRVLERMGFPADIVNEALVDGNPGKPVRS
jgi:hypothetical protein